MLLIDDAQWVDEPSGFALAFALKRLCDEPVVAIVGERVGCASLFDNAGFETIDLKGLDVDDAHGDLGCGYRSRESPNDVSTLRRAAPWRSSKSPTVSTTISTPDVQRCPTTCRSATS